MQFVIFFLLLLFLIPLFGLSLLLLFLLVPLCFFAIIFTRFFSGPGDMFNALLNRKTRMNHALEHGTLNVIEERHGPSGISGRAFDNGFALDGITDAESVISASEEALVRLSKGERGLAVRRRCSTTETLVSMISAVFFLFLLFLAGRLALVPVIISLTAAWILGPAASKTVQLLITTDPEVGGLEITGAEFRVRGSLFPGIRVVMPSELFIHTRLKREPLLAEVVDP